MQRPSLAIHRKRKAEKDPEIDFIINSLFKEKRSKLLNWDFETVTMPITKSKVLNDKKERYLVYFGGLPVEIVMLIFQYVGLEWFHRLARVSWSFNETVKTPYLLRKAAKTSINPLPMYHRGMWSDLLQWMQNYEALSQSYMQPGDRGMQVTLQQPDHRHLQLHIRVTPNPVVENFKKLRHAFMTLPAYWAAHPDKCDLPTLEQWTECILMLKNKGPGRTVNYYDNQTDAVYAAMTADFDRLKKALKNNGISDMYLLCDIIATIDKEEILNGFIMDTQRWRRLVYPLWLRAKENIRRSLYRNYGLPVTDPETPEQFLETLQKARDELPANRIPNLAWFVLLSKKPDYLAKVVDTLPELGRLPTYHLKDLFKYSHCSTKLKLYVDNYHHQAKNGKQLWQKAFSGLVVKKDCTWDELIDLSNELDFQTFIYDLACGHIGVQRKEKFVRALFTSRKKEHVLKGIKISVLLTRYDTISLLSGTQLNKKDLCHVLRCIKREHYKQLMDEALKWQNSKLVSALFFLGYEPEYCQIHNSRRYSNAIQKEFKNAQDRILF